MTIEQIREMIQEVEDLRGNVYNRLVVLEAALQHELSDLEDYYDGNVPDK